MQISVPKTWKIAWPELTMEESTAGICFCCESLLLLDPGATQYE